MNLQNLFNNISLQHVVYLLIALVWIGGWIGQVAKSQNEKRRKEQAKREREEAMLRSGKVETDVPVGVLIPGQMQTRPPGQAQPQHIDPRQVLEEIARRRQAQLEELRRRQAAAQGSTSLPRGPQTARPAPPKREKPQRPARKPAQASTPASQQARPQARRPAPAAAPAPPVRTAEETELVRQAAIRDVIAQEALDRPKVTRHAAQSATVLGMTLNSPADWRRAIVLQSVLGKPAALSGPHDPLS